MQDNFVKAVDKNGKVRYVPPHYLDNPRFGYKAAPSTRAKSEDKAKNDKKEG